MLGIGFAPSTLYEELPELIRQLRASGDIELGLSELITLQQVEALKRGRIDIGLERIRIDDPAVVQEVIGKTLWSRAAKQSPATRQGSKPG